MLHLLFLATVAVQLGRPAPAVPPAGGATGRAVVRIISAVAIGSDLAPPSQANYAHVAELRLADGSTRPTITYEFE